MTELLWALGGAIAGQVLSFLVRPVGRLLDRRYQDATTAAAEQVKEEIAGDPSRLRDFLMLQILETTFVGTLFGIIAGVLFAASSVVGFGTEATRWTVMAGQVVSVVGAIVVLHIAGLAIRVGRAVWDRDNPSGAM